MHKSKRSETCNRILLAKCLIVMALLVVPAIPQIQAAGKTWHVPEDYPTIDAAIIAASPGDTIQVRTGTYPGFTIDKTLSIIGSGAPTTGDVKISASQSTLTSFIAGKIEIKGNSNNVFNNTAGSVYIPGKENKITKNKITATGYSYEVDAVYIEGGNNEISGNTIIAAGTGDYSNGIVVYSIGNKIFSNNITSPWAGIELFISGNNEIYKNEITSDRYGIFSPFQKDILATPIISGNTINTGYQGISIDCPKYGKVEITDIKTHILYNNINTHGKYGKVAGIIMCGNAEVSANTINTHSGIEVNFGNNKISDNNINVSNFGITINHSNGNEIFNNHIKAIDLGMDIHGDSSNITGNTISNSNTGIKLIGSSNKILWNNFINNKNQAQDDGSSNIWYKDDKGNYWSDWTGTDNGNGVIDKPRVIAGAARSVDRYPLAFSYQGSKPNPPKVTTITTSTTKSQPAISVNVYNNYDTDAGILALFLQKLISTPTAGITNDITISIQDAEIKDMKPLFSQKMDVTRLSATPNQYKFRVVGPSTLDKDTLQQISIFTINAAFISKGQPPPLPLAYTPEPPQISLTGIEITLNDGTKTTIGQNVQLKTWKDSVNNNMAEWATNWGEMIVGMSPIDINTRFPDGTQIGAVYENGRYVRDSVPKYYFYSGHLTSPQIIMLPKPDDSYTLTVVGTGNGSYEVASIILNTNTVSIVATKDTTYAGKTESFTKPGGKDPVQSFTPTHIAETKTETKISSTISTVTKTTQSQTTIRTMTVERTTTVTETTGTTQDNSQYIPYVIGAAIIGIAIIAYAGRSRKSKPASP